MRCHWKKFIILHALLFRFVVSVSVLSLVCRQCGVLKKSVFLCTSESLHILLCDKRTKLNRFSPAILEFQIESSHRFPLALCTCCKSYWKSILFFDERTNVCYVCGDKNILLSSLFSFYRIYHMQSWSILFYLFVLPLYFYGV